MRPTNGRTAACGSGCEHRQQPGSGSSRASLTPGYYAVSLWAPTISSNTAAARVRAKSQVARIRCSPISERANGGHWNPIGYYLLDANSNGDLGDGGVAGLAADAVDFQFVSTKHGSGYDRIRRLIRGAAQVGRRWRRGCISTISTLRAAGCVLHLVMRCLPMYALTRRARRGR